MKISKCARLQFILFLVNYQFQNYNMMSEPRKLYQKIYSERALESCHYAIDSDKKQFISNYTTLPLQKTDSILYSINDLIQQTLNKTTLELEESVYMSSKIAGEILKSECLDKLKNINTLKAVLFQLIILIKQQSLSNQKNFEGINPQIKTQYLMMKSAFNQFKNHIKETKTLINQAMLLFSEILYQNNDFLCQNRSKRMRTQNMLKQFEAMKFRISDFISNQKISVSLDKHKPLIIEQYQLDINKKDQEILLLKKQLKVEKETNQRKLVNINEQLLDKNDEIQMLRDRISTLIINQSVIDECDYSDSKEIIAASQPQQMFLNLLLIQSITIQNML